MQSISDLIDCKFETCFAIQNSKSKTFYEPLFI